MKAHELLSDESKWTTHHAARDSMGMPCSFTDATACCFCIYGAIRKCYGANCVEQIDKVKDKLGMLHLFSVFEWNDSSTFEQVRSTLLELDI